MKTFLILFGVALLCILLMMAGLGLKMLFRRSHTFHRPCANADPRTGRCAHCTCEKRNR